MSYVLRSEQALNLFKIRAALGCCLTASIACSSLSLVVSPVLVGHSTFFLFFALAYKGLSRQLTGGTRV